MQAVQGKAKTPSLLAFVGDIGIEGKISSTDDDVVRRAQAVADEGREALLAEVMKAKKRRRTLLHLAKTDKAYCYLGGWRLQPLATETLSPLQIDARKQDLNRLAANTHQAALALLKAADVKRSAATAQAVTLLNKIANDKKKNLEGCSKELATLTEWAPLRLMYNLKKVYEESIVSGHYAKSTTVHETEDYPLRYMYQRYSVAVVHTLKMVIAKTILRRYQPYAALEASWQHNSHLEFAEMHLKEQPERLSRLETATKELIAKLRSSRIERLATMVEQATDANRKLNLIACLGAALRLSRR